MSNNASKINPIISERLKGLLEEKNKSQKWLADQIPISPSSVCLWLSGDKGISKQNAERCAQVFGCTAAYILGLSRFKTEKEGNAFYEEEMKRSKERDIQKRKQLKDRKKKVMDAVMMSYTWENEILTKGKAGSYVAHVDRYQMDMLADGLIAMIDTYVDQFILQNRHIVE